MKYTKLFLFVFLFLASCSPPVTSIPTQTFTHEPTATQTTTQTPMPTPTMTLSPTPTEMPIIEYPVNTNWEDWYKIEIPSGAILDGSYYRYIKTLDWSKHWTPERVAKLKFLPLSINKQGDIVPSPETAPNYKYRDTRPYEHLAFNVTHKFSHAFAVVVIQFAVQNLDPQKYPIAIGVWPLDGGQYLFDTWPNGSKRYQMQIMTQDVNVIALNPSLTRPFTTTTKEDYDRFMGIDANGNYVSADHLGDPMALEGKVVTLGVVAPGYKHYDPELYRQYQ
jgi:hypothetical protein